MDGAGTLGVGTHEPRHVDTPGAAGVDDSAPDLARLPEPVVGRVAFEAQIERDGGPEDGHGEWRQLQGSKLGELPDRAQHQGDRQHTHAGLPGEANHPTRAEPVGDVHIHLRGSGL